MANYLTEAQMNVYFGWTQGSDMPGVYVHLSGRDVDDAILKANGIIQKAGTPSNIEKEAGSSKIDLSSVIEAKVNKLVETKIAELLEFNFLSFPNYEKERVSPQEMMI